MVDEIGALSALQFSAGVARLEGLGYTVVSSPPQHLPDRRREVELIVDDQGGNLDTTEYARACATAFGTEVQLGVVTYISRGTDDDALGVLRRFGLRGDVVREVLDADDEIVTVTIAREDGARVPESRLRTALEAALNCDVRLVVPAQA
jgi:hypothetical protein